jgi:hypothetical protein
MFTIRLEAKRTNVTISELVRGILKKHFEMAYYTNTSGVVHLESFICLGMERPFFGLFRD